MLATVRAGARGYLLKDADDDQIAAVLRGIARGESDLRPTNSATSAGATRRVPEQADRVETATFPQLSQREREVLERLARRVRTAAIASELFLSERTVRNYVSNIFTKMQVADRAQAIVVARDAGIGQSPIT